MSASEKPSFALQNNESGEGVMDAYIPPYRPSKPDLDDYTVREVVVTFFTDHLASTKREQRLTPTALAELIHTTAAKDKASLPWVKLARFGDQRTNRGSLR